MPAGWSAQTQKHSREPCKLQRTASQERLQPCGGEQRAALLTLKACTIARKVDAQGGVRQLFSEKKPNMGGIK